ncbi:glycoside hydrolase family 10 protein [Rufibacter sediminis]|uniref:Family 10 glycosylhydrolase n=1 Tax=Rufibacter sediminis TaxID=2762756 RepID=A0ABR6VSU5_9BACT|nr:family 10 glycosylhydrolase [Rufibacter sediminis]MBC3540259.1 family 10 glycosylhydrolase [Rufibacter sediminis]
MLKHFCHLLALAFLLSFQTVSAQELPNREFRGVWVATVANLDWPKQGASPESQKAALRQMFDKIKEANLNVVFFQIRTECDAFYRSSYEPWSRFLTGTQGKDPGYDPLAFAIEEAHARGLELHAWMNPYRVGTVSNPAVYNAQHVSKSKPEWLLSFSNGKKILNPGLPEVRQYIANIIWEVTQNYAIDGIHFDDYFYPYPEGTFTGIGQEDAQTFQQHGAGFANIKDWRRNNVNETMRLVHTQIKNLKPQVRFGVSPFGIWKNGQPAGISGMDAYNAIYADALHWLDNKYVDYLTPQLYWAIGGRQDYRKLLYWWSDKAAAAARHLYPGHIVVQNGFTSEEVPHQIEISRSNQEKNALGSVLFRAANLVNNHNFIATSLQAATFRLPAAPPVMPWMSGKAPAAPLDVTVTLNEATGTYQVRWTRNPENTQAFKRYLVYATTTMPATGALIPDGSVRAFTSAETATIAAADVPSPTSFWAVSEINHANQESELSNVVVLGNALPVLAQQEKPILTVEQLGNQSRGEIPTNLPSTEAPTSATSGNVYVAINLTKKSGVKADLYTMDRKKKTRVLKEKYKAGSHTLTIQRGKLAPGTYMLVLEYGDKRSVQKVEFK